MWKADSGSISFICSSLEDGNMRANPSLQREWLDSIDAPPVGAHLVPRVGGWGATVKVVDRSGSVQADALIIRRSLQFRLTILPGDCPPIVLVDEGLPALALIHGSKDALERGVIPRTLGRWRAIGASRGRTYVWVGPGIRSCCYRFPKSIAKDKLRRWPTRHMWPDSLCHEDGFWSVSLQGMVSEQLRAVGLMGGFTIAPECTCCSTKNEEGFLFSSHRRSTVKEEPESRFLAVTWLK